MNWTNRPTSVECVATGTVECREGTFPLVVALQGGGVNSGSTSAGRQWMIVRPQNGGFIDQARTQYTSYGWLVSNLEQEGGGFGKAFVSSLRGVGGLQYAYRGFVAPGGDWTGWATVIFDRTGLSQIALAAPAFAFGDAGYAEYLDKHFFRGPKGTELAPAQKAKFRASWDEYGLRPAGEKLKDPSGGTSDRDNAITITETAVEVRVPVEILLSETPGGKVDAARGRLVVACTDPALLDLVKQLKESADPARVTRAFPESLSNELLARFKDPKNPGRWMCPWRVVRVESSLEQVIVAPPARPGGPGGPGG